MRIEQLAADTGLAEAKHDKYLAKADFSRLKRYVITMLRHLTLRRCINFCLLETELFLRRSKPSGYPYQLVIDPNNICQLRCPLCSTGRRMSGRPLGEMSFELFKKAIDELSQFGLHVFLHNWGEPLLHKDIFKFISYARDANLGTTLSSNLSFPLSGEMAKRLILSGLETLVISLDGVTRSTYERYRIGGNFDQIISNVRILAKTKKDMGRKLPILEWQFLMMKHNEHEIREARRRYKELGFDSIFFPKINLPHDEDDPRLAWEWLPLDNKRRPIFNYDKADNIPGCCWWLWRTTVINHDGGVSPCCYIDNKKSDFGNIAYDSFSNIWKGELYRSARSLFSPNDHKALKTTVCGSCNVVKRWKRKYAK